MQRAHTEYFKLCTKCFKRFINRGSCISPRYMVSSEPYPASTNFDIGITLLPFKLIMSKASQNAESRQRFY